MNVLKYCSHKIRLDFRFRLRCRGGLSLPPDSSGWSTKRYYEERNFPETNLLSRLILHSKWQQCWHRSHQAAREFQRFAAASVWVFHSPSRVFVADCTMQVEPKCEMWIIVNSRFLTNGDNTRSCASPNPCLCEFEARSSDLAHPPPPPTHPLPTCNRLLYLPGLNILPHLSMKVQDERLCIPHIMTFISLLSILPSQSHHLTDTRFQPSVSDRLVPREIFL